MGHHNIRFDGDPYSLAGVWGPSTSRANFCEEDYALTFYLTEFINSLTNGTYIYLALRSMYGAGDGGLLAPRWDAMSLSLLVLGIGSFLFHASLRQTLEFVDEFSMLGLVWSMLQATYTIRTSPTRHRAVSAVIATGFASFGIFYLWRPKIIYQVIAFAFGVLLLILRTQYLYHWLEPAFPAVKRRDWDVRTWKAIGVALVGYALWNIDLEYCAQLRHIRRQLGLPWAWLFELHGWWHVLTAIATSRFMDVAREMRREVEQEDEKKKKKKKKKSG